MVPEGGPAGPVALAVRAGVLSGDEFVEFLTLPAYEELLKLER